MARSFLQSSRSAVLVVDIQPSFLAAIYEKERVLARSAFLLKAARILDVPVVATEQYPSRMGATHEAIAQLVSGSTGAKMEFSCCGCAEVTRELTRDGMTQIVLVGIETHICVSQTSHHLLDQGYEVIVCADAVGARTVDRHQIGIERIREAGAVISHTESVVYEWMGSADHPRFRDVLSLVKAAEG